MGNLIFLFLCFGLGYTLKRSSRFPSGSFRVLNGFIIHISLPSLVLLHIHRLQIQSDLLYAAAMPWLVFLLSFGIFWSLYKWGKISREVAGALILTTGFGNTSFVGLPLIEAYYGKEMLGVGILLDQMGTFLCLGTVGIVFAIYAKQGVFQWKSMGKMVLFFPPTQALVLAFVLRPWEYPDWAEVILQKLGDTLTPLALVSVGLQLSLKEVKGKLSLLGIALTQKLILAPLFIYVLYFLVIGIRGESARVIVFEAGMAPMITSSIVAIENDLKPELVALILSIGILVSFGSTAVLYKLLGTFG